MLKYLVAGFLVFGISACAKEEEVSKTAETGTSEMKKHVGHHHEEKSEKKLSEKSMGLCPVIPTEEASKEYSYVYKGKTYYFCCTDCIEKFKGTPEKYISKIKEINLESYQYGFSPDPVVVKKGDIVRLTVTSRDVAHGIYIKEYGIKLAVKKGEHKKAEFLADKIGNFDILCSVYCGSGHSKMKGKLIVEK